jgi:hypothetical protein
VFLREQLVQSTIAIAQEFPGDAHGHVDQDDMVIEIP